MQIERAGCAEREMNHPTGGYADGMWTARHYSLHGTAADHAVELTPGRDEIVHLRLTLPEVDGQWQACRASLGTGGRILQADAGTNRGAGWVGRPLRPDEQTLLAAVIAEIDDGLGWAALADAMTVVGAERRHADAVAQVAAAERALADAQAACTHAREEQLQAVQALAQVQEIPVTPAVDMLRLLDVP